VIAAGYKGPLEGLRWPLPNVWLGVSAEDQLRAEEERISFLLATPAAVRFVSAEPLLGPIKLQQLELTPLNWRNALTGRRMVSTGAAWTVDDALPGLDWVIVGGESGPGARPMHPDWARQIRDDCAAAGVPFFFKQWGEWAPGECGCDAVTRTEQTATWFDERWSFGALTPRESSELHADDEPDLYRFGKARAGRTLDGVTHDAMPEPAPC
jgi:protein gp37